MQPDILKGQNSLNQAFEFLAGTRAIFEWLDLETKIVDSHTISQATVVRGINFLLKLPPQCFKNFKKRNKIWENNLILEALCKMAEIPKH